MKNYKQEISLNTLFGQIPLSRFPDDSWVKMTLVFANGDDALYDPLLLWEIQKYATGNRRTYFVDEAGLMNLIKVDDGFRSDKTPMRKTIESISAKYIADADLGDTVVIIGTDLENLLDYFDINGNSNVKNVYIFNSGLPGATLRSFMSTVLATEYSISAELTT